MDIEGIQQHLNAAQRKSKHALPPVELWNPDYCGELNLVIRANGQWLLDNSPLTRRPLQLLFSSIIKREADCYYLVTPVEKLGIQVEWQPFVIVDFEWMTDARGEPQLKLTDNCDNQIHLTEAHQWQLTQYQGVELPIVLVRRNLWASFDRACYYRLVEQAKIDTTSDQSQATITSNQIVFSLGRLD